MSAPADFLPAASLDMLWARAELLARVRQFFAVRAFLEVETPILSHDVVVDRHLDPLAVTLFNDAREPNRGKTLWLQTSPEFGMKRLLVALHKQNCPAIYQITRAFRGGEVGALHNPEFTMVEWYRVGDDYAAGMQLLADFASAMLGLGQPEQITYRDAFREYAEIDPGKLSDVERDRILVTRVEPHLGVERPTIVYDYPASQSALARVRNDDPPVAERFELYVRGVELANGYHELLDPAILRERNQTANEQRQADGKPALPAESRLLAAMDHGLPACAGTALGFDRLLMVAMGAKTIQDVMPFPIDRA